MQLPRICVVWFSLWRLLSLVIAQTTSPAEQGCQDMEGECTACVCCCYRSGLDLMRYRPNANCECESELAPGFVVSMVLLGVSLVTSLISGCYFAGKLPVTPFKVAAALPSVELNSMQR